MARILPDVCAFSRAFLNGVLFTVRESILVYCTRGEIDYLEYFRTIPEEQLEAWSGAPLANPALWLWNGVQHGVEFYYLRKNGPYWDLFCRNERRLRSKPGCTLPYQCFATFLLGLEFSVDVSRGWPIFGIGSRCRACVALSADPFSCITCASWQIPSRHDGLWRTHISQQRPQSLFFSRYMTGLFCVQSVEKLSKGSGILLSRRFLVTRVMRGTFCRSLTQSSGQDSVIFLQSSGTVACCQALY